MKQSLITSTHEKGIHATGLFMAAYNKAKLDEDQAQLLNERGGEFQEDISAAIRKYTAGVFRPTGELTIRIPALPRPTLEELQVKFSWVKSIERDTSPTEAVTLTLGTVLRTDETSIGGKEYEIRLAPKLPVALGYQHANWLIKHQDEFPKLMALLGKIYIDFPGLVVVDSRGGRSYPCLHGVGKRWEQRWHWISRDLGQSGRVAVASK